MNESIVKQTEVSLSTGNWTNWRLSSERNSTGMVFCFSTNFSVTICKEVQVNNYCLFCEDQIFFISPLFKIFIKPLNIYSILNFNV